MSEKKGGVELIERLLNPMWAHSNMPFESPQLEQEENLAAMRDAAKEIQRLLAIPDAAQERIRAETIEECAKIASGYDQPGRFKVSDTWKDELTPSAVYEIAMIDASNWIAKEIRAALSTASPIPEKEESK